MSRTMSAIVIMLMFLSLFICVSPAAYAHYDTIPIGKSIYGIMSNSKIEAHLEYLEIDDERKGSTQTTTPLERVKWVRLFYRYENHGDSVGTGNLVLVFIDQQGNEYKPGEGTYTGETVAPGTTSNLEFVEVPVPKDSNIVTIRVVQAFEHTDFAVPGFATTTASPTGAPSSTTTATAQATGNGGTRNCLPLLPFALISIIGLAGLTVVKKREK